MGSDSDDDSIAKLEQVSDEDSDDDSLEETQSRPLKSSGGGGKSDAFNKSGGNLVVVAARDAEAEAGAEEEELNAGSDDEDKKKGDEDENDSDADLDKMKSLKKPGVRATRGGLRKATDAVRPAIPVEGSSASLDKVPPLKNTLSRRSGLNWKTESSAGGAQDEGVKKEEKYSQMHLPSVISILEARITSRQYYKEFGYYLLFVILATTVTFMQREVGHAYLVKEGVFDVFVDNQFPEIYTQVDKTYWDIQNLGEFWQWVFGVFQPGLSNNEWYNGQPFSSDELYTANFYNYVIGAVRFRQLRVQRDWCEIRDDESKDYVSYCYWFYTQWSKDDRPYGPPNNPELFKYQSPEEAGGRWIWGWVSPLYYPGGYIADIPYGADSNVTLNNLFNNRWIDGQTRTVIVNINTYNPSSHYFGCVLTLFLEMSPAGVIIPQAQVRVIKLLLYVRAADYFRLFLEIALVVFLVYFTVKICLEVAFASKSGVLIGYISDPWNFVDILNLLIYWSVVGLYVAYVIDNGRKDFDPHSDKYIDLERIAAHYTAIYNLNSINIFLIFLKMFKYLRVNAKMSIIWRTLSDATADLLAFFVLFAIIFCGFILMAHLLFGTQLDTYSSFVHSATTSFQMLLGDFDYPTLAATNRILAPIFFILFIVFCFFVLANIFSAIIIDAYQGQNKKIKETESIVAQLKGVVRKWFRSLKSFVTRKSQTKGITDGLLLQELRKARKLVNKETIELEELKQITPSLSNAWGAELDNHMQHLCRLANRLQKGKSWSGKQKKQRQLTLKELRKKAKKEKKLRKVHRAFTLS
eukprot:TRINITY_DN3094_c0_g1_i1.p1 TRINITY_DN3094_c0_g1~~TRINITY_DN3094_c0_g1_i1.p1  ORF type:complete len:806 (-),score=182.16 TRINITY_DN3094_c0_g1_i1:510-2927(-)